MAFSAFLSLIGLAPKTLPQAAATLDQAKVTFDAFNEQYARAGLDADKMLAAGPDALKAHIASVSAKDGELAAAQAKVTELEGKLSGATILVADHKARSESTVSLLTAIGFVPVATSKPEDVKAAFDSHVKQAAALELAKTGHKPVADVLPPAPGKTAAIDPSLTGAERTKAYFAAKLTSK